jgi:hypothetical protein
MFFQNLYKLNTPLILEDFDIIHRVSRFFLERVLEFVICSKKSFGIKLKKNSKGTLLQASYDSGMFLYLSNLLIWAKVVAKEREREHVAHSS